MHSFFSVLGFLATVTTAFPLSCKSLSSNMDGTRGCVIMRLTRHMTIECDGQSAESMKNLLKNFHDYGCAMPLKIQLDNPKFPITDDLFTSVRSSLYRLEISGITVNQTWHTGLFRHMHLLQILSLKFADSATAKMVHFTEDTFHELYSLVGLRLHTGNIPFVMGKNFLKPLQRLKCLGLSGTNVACDCGALNFINWLYPRKDTMKTIFRDPISGRKEPCNIHVDCAAPVQETLFRHQYTNCGSS